MPTAASRESPAGVRAASPAAPPTTCVHARADRTPSGDAAATQLSGRRGQGHRTGPITAAVGARSGHGDPLVGATHRPGGRTRSPCGPGRRVGRSGTDRHRYSHGWRPVRRVDDRGQTRPAIGRPDVEQSSGCSHNTVTPRRTTLCGSEGSRWCSDGTDGCRSARPGRTGPRCPTAGRVTVGGRPHDRHYGNVTRGREASIRSGTATPSATRSAPAGTRCSTRGRRRRRWARSEGATSTAPVLTRSRGPGRAGGQASGARGRGGTRRPAPPP